MSSGSESSNALENLPTYEFEATDEADSDEDDDDEEKEDDDEEEEEDGKSCGVLRPLASPPAASAGAVNTSRCCLGLWRCGCGCCCCC